MSLSVKRWFILAAGIIANLCQGVAYSASVFMLPLGEVLERPQEVWAKEWGIIFAMSLAFLPAGMLLSGKLADRGKTQIAIALGGLLYGGGLMLASLGHGVLWTAVTLGLMTSVGSGAAYGTVIGSMVRWFPDRRGFASGTVVAAVGVGPIVIAPLASRLMDAHGVLAMFWILGIACVVAMVGAALCISNPPAGFAPAGWIPPAAKIGAAGAPARVDLDWRRLLGRPLFWLLYACYFCGVFAGVLMNGLAAPMAVELAGFTRAEAPVAVMLFAFASAGGRVAWGFLSDRFGRIVMIGAAFALTAGTMFLLYRHVSTAGVFLPCIFLAGLCYGGIFGTFPSLSADSFGLRNAAVNLALLMTSFSLVAILAPQVVAHYRAGGAELYPRAFLVAGCVAAAGGVLTIIVARVMAAAGKNDAGRAGS